MRHWGKHILVGLFGLAVTLLSLTCTAPNGGTGSQIPNSNVSGIICNPGGTPAANAIVRFYPVGYNPHRGGLGKTKALAAAASVATPDSTKTDAKGHYSAALDSGSYNLLASGDSGQALQDSVATVKGTIIQLNDTLRPPGSIAGVIDMTGGGNPETVFIIFMGTGSVWLPADTLGNFATGNMAPGNYHVRFLTTTPNYNVLDTTLTVISGKIDTLASPIQLQFNGIPVPQGLKIQYDSNMQVVTLLWNKPTTGSPIIGYEIYRKNAAYNALPAAINGQIVTDTVYHDSTGVQDSSYEYYVAAVDTGNGVGGMSGGVIVKITRTYLLLDSVSANWGDGSSTVVAGNNGQLVDRTDDIITVYDSSLNLLNTFSLPSDFGNGFGHAVDDSNRIWTLNYNTGEMNIYTMQGLLLFSVQDTGLSFPNIIRQGTGGNMFVQCTKTGLTCQIRIYDRNGKFISFFPNNANPIMPSDINDMTFLKNGDLLILNSDDSTTIEYDSIGSIIQTEKFNSYVVRIGQMANGNYAIEQEGDRGIIDIFNSKFMPLSIIGNLPSTNYEYFGRLTVGTANKFIIRNASSIAIYKITN